MEKKFHNDTKIAEKRMHPRSTYVTHVSYRKVGDGNGAFPLKGKGLTQNISYAGMCLLLNQELSPGTILELTFERKEKNLKPIVTHAKVVWLKKTETGFLAGVKFDFN